MKHCQSRTRKQPQVYTDLSQLTITKITVYKYTLDCDSSQFFKHSGKQFLDQHFIQNYLKMMCIWDSNASLQKTGGGL